MEQQYRVETHFIRRSHQLFSSCDDICFQSKNLYNYGNFLIRQSLFHLGERFSYTNLQFQVKKHATYKLLPAQTAQQTLIQLEHNWSAFFKAMRAWKVNPGKFLGCPLPPKYKAKNGRIFAYFTNQQCKIKDSHIRFPKTDLLIHTKVSNTLKEVRVIPEGNCYKIEVVYVCDVPKVPLIASRIAAIDVGVDNLATIANNAGIPPIAINGMVLKSINQWYNRERGRLQHIKDKQEHPHETKKLYKLTTCHNQKIHTLLHKASR
jgi:putative transposase